MISEDLYQAIVEAETSVRKAHNLCYADDGKHGAGFWLVTRLGKCQSILMHYVVKYANPGDRRYED